MESLSQIRMLERLCEATGKWGLFISIYEPEGGPFEAQLAAPYLDPDSPEHMQIIVDGCGVFLFDDYNEMERCYWQTVGDDGPTKLNDYNGQTRVYALTCDIYGQTMNENT